MRHAIGSLHQKGTWSASKLDKGSLQNGFSIVPLTSFAERTVVHSGNGYQKTLITNNSPKNLASPHRILTYSLIPPVCSFIFQAPMLPNLREKLHPFRGRGGCPSLRCVRSSSTKVPIWPPEQRFLKVQKTVHRFGDPKDPCIFTYI